MTNILLEHDIVIELQDVEDACAATGRGGIAQTGMRVPTYM